MRTRANEEIIILPDLAGISETAAQRFAALARERAPFSVALSGGGTPRGLYEKLAAAPFKAQIQWTRVHVFWGDERCVPPDDPGSNYHLARETLLDRVPIPSENIHRMRGECAPEAAARLYDDELRAFFGSPMPRFDLVLLGMGVDGHTASIFPNSTTLREITRAVAPASAEYADRPASRITLTLPAINAARCVIFLVSGADKAEILREVLDSENLRYPAQLIHPVMGKLVWIVDAAAAALLEAV